MYIALNSHCGKTRDSLQRKIFPSNWFRLKFFSENVNFTEFLRQNHGSKISIFPHCEIQTQIAYSDQKFCNWDRNYDTPLHQAAEEGWFLKSPVVAALNVDFNTVALLSSLLYAIGKNFRGQNKSRRKVGNTVVLATFEH